MSRTVPLDTSTAPAEHPDHMRQIADETRLSADVDGQPLVQAAVALQPVIRRHHDELEREQRLPKVLVEAFHTAGSAGWNVANNSIGQLVTLGLPDEGVQEIYAERADTVIAGTAVMGGGRAVPVDGGYR